MQMYGKGQDFLLIYSHMSCRIEVGKKGEGNGNDR